MLMLFAPCGCTTGGVVSSADDYSDEAWSALTARDDSPAELEDAAAQEDATEPPDLVGDEADLAETDDVITDPEPDVLAPTSIELAAAAGQYQNPVAGSCADPGVIRIDAADGPTFWAACTGNGELRGDGLGFVGARHRLLKNTLGWEGDVVEAPWVKRRGKYYFMFYSGFRYRDHTYGVCVARATSPLGPFSKRSAPIVRSNDVWIGPGHNSVVATGGHDYLVYHGWHGAHVCGQAGNRALLLDPITWKGGWPFVNNGSPSRGVHTAPTTP